MKKFLIICQLIIFLVGCIGCTSKEITSSESITLATTPNALNNTPTPSATPTNIPQPTATPNGGGEHIVFFAVDSETWKDIYIMNSDGSDVKTLVETSIFELYYKPFWQINWSPNGNKLAFSVVDYDAIGSLYVVNADGNDLRKLATVYGPFCVWSPGSKQVAFVQKKDDRITISTIGADGSNLTQLVDVERRVYWLDWLPNGKEISFTDLKRYMINADGSNLRELGDNRGGLLSPDGRQVAFVESGNNIHLMTPDGNNIHPLIHEERDGIITYVVWSPNGKEIAFVSRQNPDSEIGRVYVVNLESGQTHQLTDDVVTLSSSPVWSPDGKQIVLSGRNDDGTFGIYLVNTEGGNFHRLKDYQASKYFGFAWQP